MKHFIILLFTILLTFNIFGQQTAFSEYKCVENSIELKFSATNRGKFRFKTRNTNQSFGETFATRQKSFNETVYLEWQIGYDALVEDVKSGKKQTKLTQATFLSSNGREKYLFELSEILYDAIKCGVISVGEIDHLRKEINAYNNFIDERKIIIEESINIAINGLPFEQTNTKLPTVFMPQTSDKTYIEVSIQKQQYATGIQPMIYFCIPFKSFSNWQDLDGKKSVKGNELKYFIRKENSEVILNMFKVFGMTSRQHKFDVEQILKTIGKLT